MTTASRAKKAKKHAVLAARTKKPTRASAAHADRKAAVVQEESATTPSRKSTRKSSNRAKSTTNLELRAERALSAPKRRATMSKAKTSKVRGKPVTK